MNVIETSIPGVLVFEPKIFNDSRGHFLELYEAARYAAHGLPDVFAQDNLSHSKRGVLRGLHLQNPKPQGKLVTVLAGVVLDVAVDVRLGSPTFARHVAVELDARTRRQIWIPRGFAHGFVVRSETADVLYKSDDVYSPSSELVLQWNDPALAINWGIAAPELVARDRAGCTLSELSTRLPRFGTA